LVILFSFHERLVNVSCRYRGSPNRFQITTPVVARRIRARIWWLEKELNHTDGDVEEVVEAGTGWKENEALLRSVPGVDPVLARILLAKLPKLGTLTQAPLCLGGGAPFNRHSGQRCGKREVWGGRASVRDRSSLVPTMFCFDK
jgi:transposase